MKIRLASATSGRWWWPCQVSFNNLQDMVAAARFEAWAVSAVVLQSGHSHNSSMRKAQNPMPIAHRQTYPDTSSHNH